ncbi:hypothetical protein BVRB_2g034940 [Beta vulgaris subsp. vulgaris]|nr:hypothetical protein BVRB_2g034940 [Beta vulgaris subsp. vulgaris]
MDNGVEEHGEGCVVKPGRCPAPICRHGDGDPLAPGTAETRTFSESVGYRSTPPRNVCSSQMVDKQTPKQLKCSNSTVGTSAIRRSSPRNSEAKRTPLYFAKLAGANYRKCNKQCKGGAVEEPSNPVVNQNQMGKAGLGGVCRGQDGNWILGFKKKLYLEEAYEAEIMAIKESLLWAGKNGWRNVIIATDCKRAVEDIYSQDRTKSRLTKVLNICRTLLDQGRGLSLKHEPRDYNTLADHMAKEARKDIRESFELEDIINPSPVCIDILSTELESLIPTEHHEENMFHDPALRFPP